MLDDPKKTLGLCRLAHDLHSSGFLGFLRDIGTRRQDNYWNVGKERAFYSFSEEPPSIEYRHNQVQENQRRPSVSVVNVQKCVIAIIYTVDHITPERQEVRKGLTGFSVVVDNQNHKTFPTRNLILGDSE
jgi:hypothetical protein